MYAPGASSASGVDLSTLEVLHDLGEWDLEDVAWGLVADVLTTMSRHLAVGDADATHRAATRLELLGQMRAVRLGTPVVGRAPRPVRLLRSRLVHGLGIADRGPTAADADLAAVADLAAAGDQGRARGPGELSAPRGPTRIREQEVVLDFYAAVHEGDDRSYPRLGRVWYACVDQLGTTDAIPGLGLSTVPPVDRPTPASPGSIAAAQNADRSVQVILRRVHDVLTLSVLLAHEESWAGLDRAADRVSGAADALLGTARLYLGLTDTPGPDPAWPFAEGADDFAAIGECTLAELPSTDDLRSHRRLMVVAAPDAGHALSAFAWSRGDTAVPRLTQYLVQAAKVRYEGRLWQSSLGRGLVRRAVDRATLVTGLRDMRLATRAALENMATVLGPTGRVGVPEEDRSLGEWLIRQIETDIEYLENAPPRRAGRDRSSSTSDSPSFGLIAVLPEEFAAMKALMNTPVHHDTEGDHSGYVVGTMPSSDPRSPHRVVLTVLADTATHPAAEGTAQLIRSHPSVAEVILVGIAAGVPAPTRPERHVRVGDVVVAGWGVVPYDHVVDTPGERTQRQPFPLPSSRLCQRAKLLVAGEHEGDRPWEALLDRIIVELPDFARPPNETDRLYVSDDPSATVVAHPDATLTGHRPGRPKVHNGLIASGDRSMRNIRSRDRIAARHGALAIEMEAAGVGVAAYLAGRDWFVVRGISDYADSRLDHGWRRYASAAAAAYVGALLARCSPIPARG